MNSKVHPALAALVLIMTLIAVGLWTWGSGKAASFGGPAELSKDPDGHSYVQIQNYLVEHDAQGEYLKTHELRELNIELFLGGYAFFSNGDVLLRRGADPRSFLDNVRAFRRETNRNPIAPQTPESGLFRCNIDTFACERFGQEGVDFKASYGVFIDWQTDEVYISDTTRHLLRKYSADGVELAPPVAGFKFPNQLMLHDGQLFVADTNHHVIRRLDPSSSTFARAIAREDVLPSAAKTARQIWPSHFARVGENWWVNNMQTGMNRGGLYVFNDEWEYVRRVDLPPNADPISILVVEDAVWVSDWNNDVVRRFSAAGESLENLKSAGLETILSTSRLERRRYRILSYAGVAGVALIFVGLITQALVRTTTKEPDQDSARPDPVGEGVDMGPLHLEPDQKMQKRMTMVVRSVAIFMVLGVGSLGYILSASGNPDVVLLLIGPVALMAGIVILVAWTNRANWGTSVTLDGDTVTLRDHTGRESRCSIRDVCFDDTAIATRDCVVILGRPRARIYDNTDVQERLIPRLGKAQRLGPLGMLKLQIQFRHPQGIVVGFAFLVLVAYGAMQLVACL